MTTTDPATTDPATTDPAPTDPAPADPAAGVPAPADPAPADPAAGVPAAPRRQPGRLVLAAGAVVVVAATATVAALGVFHGDAGGSPTGDPLPPATAEVTRTTMVRTESFDGTLGYGEPVTVTAAGTGAGDAAAGVLTWRPGLGEIIGRGEPVYSVNAEPVVLVYGDLPFFRELGAGASGVDVAQLEENLAALGYDGFTVDDDYTWSTTAAVTQWQADLGLATTGRFDPTRTVVAPGEIRVAEHLAPLGAAASGAVLTYTATDRLVTVDLDVSDQRYVDDGMPVTVTLPDGGTVAGTVTHVGTVATGGDSADLPQDSEPTTIEVEITVDDTDALGDWDTAPVDVAVEVDRREDVLAVPVGALVALAEGGYGVQVVDGGQSSYVAVTTGMFADGLVEISGAGLAEGVLVGVPS